MRPLVAPLAVKCAPRHRPDEFDDFVQAWYRQMHPAPKGQTSVDRPGRRRRPGNAVGVSAVPMRPWQNALAIIGGFLVAGALLPWSSRLRLTCAFGAIAIVFILLAARMSAHAKVRTRRSHDDAWSRIERIREERAARNRRR